MSREMRGAVRGSADRKVIRLTRPVVNFNPAFGSRPFESSHLRFNSENFDSKDRSTLSVVRRSSSSLEPVCGGQHFVCWSFSLRLRILRILGILSQDTLYRILSPPLSCHPDRTQYGGRGRHGSGRGLPWRHCTHRAAATAVAAAGGGSRGRASRTTAAAAAAGAGAAAGVAAAGATAGDGPSRGTGHISGATGGGPRRGRH